MNPWPNLIKQVREEPQTVIDHLSKVPLEECERALVYLQEEYEKTVKRFNIFHRLFLGLLILSFVWPLVILTGMSTLAFLLLWGAALVSTFGVFMRAGGLQERIVSIHMLFAFVNREISLRETR